MNIKAGLLMMAICLVATSLSLTLPFLLFSRA